MILGNIERVGKFLFRYRAAIAVPFFILLFLFGRYRSFNLFPIFLILAGTGIRIWAAGYIGENARKSEFKTWSRITNGPYKLLRHPLYLGNLLLVTGVTIIYYPPLWLSIMIMIAFFVVYIFIIISESFYVKKLPSSCEVFMLKNARHEISTLLIVALILTICFVKRCFFI